MPRLLSLVATLLGVFATIGAAQSLGEVAKRERERRAKSAPKTPAPSFTDADLAARRGVPAEAASPSPSPAPSSSPGVKGSSPTRTAGNKPAQEESAARQQQEAKWRARFEAARERVRVAEAGAWRTVIETVFVSGIPVQQEVRKFEETEELRNAKAALADLEEEFHRTGLPAGWAR